MKIRTDMAVEFAADKESSKNPGLISKVKILEGIKITTVNIKTYKAAHMLGKSKGKYITLESKLGLSVFDNNRLCYILADILENLIDGCKNVLVVGIGNSTITPDALGPKTTEKIFVTNHIPYDLAKNIGMSGIKSVSAISPGVIGQTGISTLKLLKSIIYIINPSMIIFVDALASSEVSRLGRTLQISNTGLIPGSGVGNGNYELTEETLGVKCITIGVPTIVDMTTFYSCLTGNQSSDYDPFIATPRDIDRLVEKASFIISKSINLAIHRDLSEDVIMSCV